MRKILLTLTIIPALLLPGCNQKKVAEQKTERPRLPMPQPTPAMMAAANHGMGVMKTE